MPDRSLADKARENLDGGNNPGLSMADLAYQQTGATIDYVDTVASERVKVLGDAQTSGNAVISTTSTTFVDVDAAVLAVTFTVPPSGIVYVELEAIVRNNGGEAYWGIREGSSDVAGTQRLLGVSLSAYIRMRARIKISGLTPAASLTYKWAHRGSAGTVTTGGSDVWGPARMEVSG